jgi:hypothetical protein
MNTNTPETDPNEELNLSYCILYAQTCKIARERDEAREALKTGGLLDIIDRAGHERAHAICERDEAREQRDRLAEALRDIRIGYGGQVAIPDCDCGDCAFLFQIDNALQSLTPPNNP